MQVTRACTRSNIARLAASHAGLYARLTLVIVTTPPRNAPEIVGGSPSETSEVFWSIDVPVPLKLRAGCLNEIDEEPAGRGDVGSHDHDSEPAPFIGTPLAPQRSPTSLQRT